MPQINEEQQKALMEKLKDMSPEELREFQKKQCVFCQIAAKKMEGKIVYEDEKSIAILDINPASVGHVLLLPKEHYSIMPQIPEEEIAHLGIVAKNLSLAVLKGLKVQGTTLFIANGSAAGQRAQHFMLHIIPRKEGDNLGLPIPQRQINEEALRKLHEVVQNKVNEIFGIKKEVFFETKEGKSQADEKKKIEKVNEVKKSRESNDSRELEKRRKAFSSEEKREKIEIKKEKKKAAKSKKEEGASLDDIARLFT